MRSYVIAYHLIWTAYGTWLPNDPRGSTSRSVAGKKIFDLGPLHYGRRVVQPAPIVVHEFKNRAREQLLFPVIELDGEATRVVAEAFAETIVTESYTCYACAIMPDHVHLVVRKHKHRAEEMINRLQQASRLRFSISLEPIDHPLWTLGGWKGFLSSPEQARRVIRYVELNPIKSGLPTQHWPFVEVYDGWPKQPR